MILASDINELRNQLNVWRKAGNTIAFVPTMGNLHAGHLNLVKKAKASADRTVVSIFVNPLQFGPNEDFEQYPRTKDEDNQKLSDLGVDLLFMPKTSDIYPDNANTSKVIVPNLSEKLCGKSRPGHFDGVTTVVAKLFNLVQPDIAVFGQKDYQQSLIIQQMIKDLNFPIELITQPTSREEDGLALSSRNQYLTAEQRKIAPELHKTLKEIAELKDKTKFSSDSYHQHLESKGFKIDYLTLLDAETLEPPTHTTHTHVAIVAAYLGNTRLIDNILC